MDLTSVTVSVLATVILLCSTTIPTYSATRILLAPFPIESHVLPNIAIGEALMAAGGYEVFLMLPSPYHRGNTLPLKTSGIKMVEYPVPEKDWISAFYSNGNYHDDGTPVCSSEGFFEYITQVPLLTDLKTRGQLFGNLCEHLLKNSQFHDVLKSMAFDYAIIDAHPFSRCYYVLLYKLGIAYSSYIQEYDPYLLRAPAIPSYVPSIYMEKSTEKMTLWERIMNTWLAFYWSFFIQIPTMSNSLVSTYAPDRPYISITEMAQKSEMWLTDTDFLLDYPHPLMPNEVLIGGLTSKASKALPKAIDGFLSPNASKVEAIIVVNFGPDVTLPLKVTKMFLEAFRTMSSYRVIWQYRVNITHLRPSENVRTQTYLPINDLLGHKKTKLYITCGALHSQQEALFHGVPILSVPINGFQRHSARKAQYYGYGLTLDIHTATLMDVVGHINKMLLTAEFEKNVEEAAYIIQRRARGPATVVTEAINIVIDHKTNHLRAYAIEMPWYQYIMLDVLIIFGSLTLMCFWLGCSAVWRVTRKTELSPQTVTNGTVTTVPKTALSTKSKQS